MKVVELKKIIREEVRRVVKEMEVTPTPPTPPTTTTAPTTTAKPVAMKQFLQNKIADPNIAKGLSAQEMKVIQDLIDLVLTKGRGGDVATVVSKVKDILAGQTKAIKTVPTGK